MTTLSRPQNLQWKNTIYNLHDCICKCNEGIKHTLLLLTTEEIKVTKKEHQQITKCLIIGEEETTTENVDGFDHGDLEALFAVDADDGDENER